jgi:hypothetical protein
MRSTEGSRSSGVTTLRFTGLNGVVRQGDMGKLYVSVDTVTSIGSGEEGENVTVAIPVNGVRVVDSAGISETYFSSAYDEVFQVSPATTGKLTIGEATNNPVARTVQVSADNITTGVDLLTFTLRARNADVEVIDIPVGLAVTGTPSTVGSMVQTLRHGNSVTGSNLTGSATGGVVTFRITGLEIERNSVSAETLLNTDVSTDDQGKFTVEFTVSAFDEDAFVALTTNRGTTMGNKGVSYVIQEALAGFAATTTGSVAGTVLERVSGGTEVTEGGVNYIRINEGSSARFKLTVYFDPLSADSFRVQLHSVNFAATAVNATSQQVATPVEKFRTPSTFVNN